MLSPNTVATELSESTQKRQIADELLAPTLKPTSRVFWWSRGGPLLGVAGLNHALIPHDMLTYGNAVFKDRFLQNFKPVHFDLAGNSGCAVVQLAILTSLVRAIPRNLYNNLTVVKPTGLDDTTDAVVLAAAS